MAGCSDSATSWRLFDSNISCRAFASDFALCILGEDVHGVHAVLYLGDRAECRPIKWDRKRLLYLLTLLAASFSSEHFIVLLRLFS
jgi:hypothetical protein